MIHLLTQVVLTSLRACVLLAQFTQGRQGRKVMRKARPQTAESVSGAYFAIQSVAYELSPLSERAPQRRVFVFGLWILV